MTAALVLVIVSYVGVRAVTAAENESPPVAAHSTVRQTPDMVVQLYDKMENALLTQLGDALAQDRPMKEMANIVDAVGRIRSRKAIPLLKVIIDRHRGEATRPATVAHPVPVVLDPSVIRTTSSKTRFVTDAFPALGALVRIGVPLDQILIEIEKAETGSNRERLFFRLGKECHGAFFTAAVREKASAAVGSESEKWRRYTESLAPK